MPTSTNRPDWAAGTEAAATLPNPSVIPEFFGDTMLVNGTVFPQVTVEPRRYRLRFLNACNARFLNLQFYVANDTLNGITLDSDGIPTNDAGPARPDTGVDSANVLQIGTEGGFLAYPVKVPSNVPVEFDPASGIPSDSSLLVGPAERPDVIVDFSRHARARALSFTTMQPRSVPKRGSSQRLLPGLERRQSNPVNGNTPPGFGPNTRVLMRFKVVGATSNDPLAINEATPLGVDSSSGIDPFLAIRGYLPSAPRLTTRGY